MSCLVVVMVMYYVPTYTAAKDSYREQEILSPYIVHLKITAMHGYVEYPQQQAENVNKRLAVNTPLYRGCKRLAPISN